MSGSQGNAAMENARAAYLKFKTMRDGWFCKKCGRWCPNCCGRSCDKCCIMGLIGWHHCPTQRECHCFENSMEKYFEEPVDIVRMPQWPYTPPCHIGPLFGHAEVKRADDRLPLLPLMLTCRPRLKPPPQLVSFHYTSLGTLELRPVPYGVSHQDSLFTNSYQAKPYFVVHPEWNSEVVSDCTPLPMNRPPWPWEQPRYRVNMQIPITYKTEEEEIQEETQGDGAGTPTPATQPAWDYSQEVPPLSYHLSRAYRSTLPQYVVRY